MKKKICLLLFGIIFLTGCTNKEAAITANEIESMIDKKIDEIEYPSQLATEDVSSLIDNKINEQDFGLSESDISALIESKFDENNIDESSEFLSKDDVTSMINNEISTLRAEIFNYVNTQIAQINVELSDDAKAELSKNIIATTNNMIQEKINGLNLTPSQTINEYITEERNEITQIIGNQPINERRDLPVGGQFPMTFFAGTKQEFTINSISATIEPVKNNERENPYELFRVNHTISTTGAEGTKYEIIFQNSGLNYSLEINGSYKGELAQDIRMDASAIYVSNVRIIPETQEDEFQTYKSVSNNAVN